MASRLRFRPSVLFQCQSNRRFDTAVIIIANNHNVRSEARRRDLVIVNKQDRRCAVVDIVQPVG